jgi:hypothetical protein
MAHCLLFVPLERELLLHAAVERRCWAAGTILPGPAWHAAAVDVEAAAPALTLVLHAAHVLVDALLLRGLTPKRPHWLLAVLLQALLQSAPAPCACCSLLLQVLLA